MSWAGLRGAVPIVLATFPLTEGYPDGQPIFDVVFFVAVLSVLLQGLTVSRLARRLGLTAEPDLVVFGAAHPDLAAAVRAWVTEPGTVSSFR